MKRIVIFFILIACGVIASLQLSCKKDTEIKAVVVVKLASDTTEVVPFARVRLYKYDINVPGQTDKDGVFRHTFKNEAILDVLAWTVDSMGQEGMTGSTSIRLERGKEVRKSVFIN